MKKIKGIPVLSGTGSREMHGINPRLKMGDRRLLNGSAMLGPRAKRVIVKDVEVESVVARITENLNSGGRMPGCEPRSEKGSTSRRSRADPRASSSESVRRNQSNPRTSGSEDRAHGDRHTVKAHQVA